MLSLRTDDRTMRLINDVTLGGASGGTMLHWFSDTEHHMHIEQS
jgi:hypothetical protein